MTEPVGIAIEGVSKRFGAVQALLEIDIQVKAGEFLALIGPSGCGKTTLLNILAGFLTPSSGDVLIGGRAVSGRGLDRGVVFQDFAQLFPWRTAQRNVEFGLEMRGVAPAERAETAQRFLRLMGLEDFFLVASDVLEARQLIRAGKQENEAFSAWPAFFARWGKAA